MRRSFLLSLILIGTVAGLIFFLVLMTMGPAMASTTEGSDARSLADAPEAVPADPDVGIFKFMNAGYARPNGYYVYAIYFDNIGTGVAENVLITDTLPSEVTYAADTSGVSHTQTPSGELVWDMGVLQPGDSEVFMVTVNVPNTIMTGTDEIGENCVEIGTTTPGDANPNNDESCHDPVDVWEDEVDIAVNKWVDPGDPGQGQELIYTIQVCNERGAAVGPVWFTDTLPADTTFLEWRVDPWWQNFWLDVVLTESDLNLYAPGLPGDWCTRVELTLLADDEVPIGTRLTNRAEVFTEGDVNPENNEYVHRWAEISQPRYDLWLEKSIHSRSLAPGGWINYFVDYGNEGNVTSTVRITETIPNGLSFDGAWWGGGTPNENDPLPPPTIAGNLVTWELGELAVFENLWFHIQMDITDTLEAGTLIENCATIEGDGDDDNPNDNASCYEVQLNEHGLNLGINKEHEWEGDGRLYYQIRFENLGDEAVNDTWITDTLPLSTSWSGEWNSDRDGLGEPISSSGKLIWNIGYMDPGDTGWIEFTADLDEPNEPFRYFTNTVEIAFFGGGDIDEGDNFDEDVAFSGGELYWVDINVFDNYLAGEARKGPVKVETASEEVTFDEGGFFDADFEDPFLPGQTVTVTAGDGLQPVVIEIPDPYEINVDTASDQVWGQIDHLDQEWLEVDLYDGPTMMAQTDGNGNYSVTFGEMPRGAAGEVRYQTMIDYAEVTFRGQFRSLDLLMNINYSQDWVEGNYEPGHTIWITVTESDGQTVKGMAGLESGFVPWWDGQTGYSTNLEGWEGDQPDLLPGDWVFGRVDNGFTGTVKIGDIQSDLDVALDTVEGNLFASWLNTSVPVSCEIWDIENGPDNIRVPNVNTNGGSFFCDFSGQYDIQADDTVSVRYFEPDGHEIINSFSGPWMRVNYGHDWVGGNYELGHTIWITLTDSIGALKATAEVETNQHDGWGTSGFNTNEEDWAPRQPDIEISDWVYIMSDDGYDNTIQVGEISGTVDIAADSIGGPIFVPWFGDALLDVECHPWGGPDGTPGNGSTAKADGSKPYECAWTEWDIQPGQDVAVMYVEPDDRDRIINVFADPAPEMRVWKWAEGNGQVAPGGPVVFSIEYENRGNAVADPVIMTDTLPANTTYVSDSSGVTPLQEGETLTWDLGAVDPDERGQFQLVLDNSADAGDTLVNKVDITAPFNRENDEMRAEAEVEVVEGFPNLQVNKHAEPNDPSPGETFLYEIDYGNNGAVTSGPVVMTDTLPENTTVVDWYSESGYDLWKEVSGGSKLVLEAPSIPGDWGDRIVLRLRLESTVDYNTQLTNTVEIATDGDTDPEDNIDVNNDAWVNEPRRNGHVNKEFNWGVLVPGGEIEYYIHARNNGNAKAQMWLTDTLPAGTFLEEWRAWDGQQEIRPSLTIDGQTLTWDLGLMEPGAWVDVDLRLGIWQHLRPGVSLENCATIGLDGDSWPYDDESCVTEFVREAGPNLRIYKYDWWESEEGLGYDIRVENLGTELLENVWFTDTYPIDTTFEDDWWVQHGPWVTITHDGDNNQLTFWAEKFDPGETASIRFNVSVDETIIGQQGLAFTNTVAAPIDGDVYPMDNVYLVTTFSGPDIYTRKWLSDGIRNPGEIVTYTIEFGNAGRWPWWTNSSAQMTDTLPAEMTFISATNPWDPNQYWDPDILGNTLVWDLDEGLCPECWWQFDLTVQITDTAEVGDILVNKVEMYSESDREFDVVNNKHEFAIRLGEYKIFMPVVIKN